ncbi:MAG: AAA family ATPase [Acetobacter sp.]|nr:AAA family ATPase [Acetobacter sp.]
MVHQIESQLLHIAEQLDKKTTQAYRLKETCTILLAEERGSTLNQLLDAILTMLKNEHEPTRSLVGIFQSSLYIYYGNRKIRDICEHREEDTLTENEPDDVATLDDLLARLNNLVGLAKVKEEVERLIAFQKVQMLRKERHLKADNSTMHMAFMGNPGTGKTTVARIVGRIYKKLGLLSKGHFLEVSRTDLIAGYQGQTALKVHDVIKKAKGGVLFIDEAYSITENDNSDSYGRECLTVLTKLLEDYRKDLVVIVAGYTEPMQRFFKSNPGLKSRFNSFIEFEDYNKAELKEILQNMCQENDYILEQSAIKKINEILEVTLKEEKKEDFSNGRFVRNLYESLIMNHARRVARIQEPDIQVLQTIMSEDVQPPLAM